MALACPSPDPSASLMQDLSAYLECHAGAIGELGYQTFAGSSMLAALLTGCLTIYVALFGYRLLLMQDVDLRDLVVAAVRVGAVITFALHWGAYQPVVYRVVMDGPAELANIVLRPEGLAVTTASDAASRLESAYEALEQAPFGRSPNALEVPPPAIGLVAPPNAVVMPPNVVTQNGSSNFRPALNPGGVLLMISTLGPLATLQMATAILLALGPVVIVLALFDPFLGLFEGWLRALGGALLAGCGLGVILALELNFLETEVTSLTATSHTDPDIFAVAAVFGILGVGLLVAAALVALGFRIPRSTRNFLGFAPRVSSILSSRLLLHTPKQVSQQGITPSRAQAVADAVTLQARRNQSFGIRETWLPPTGELSGPTSHGQNMLGPQHPLGYSLRGRAGDPRRSLSIARRNSR